MSELELSKPEHSRRIATWLVVVFALLIAAAYVAGSTIAIIVIILYEAGTNPGFDIDQWVATAEYDGFVLAMSTMGGMALCIPVTILFAGYQKEVSVAEYLALRNVSLKSYMLWGLVGLALIAASDGVTLLLDRDVVPEYVRQVYASSSALPWLWIALIILAPIGEELLFRGFLFTGLQTSRLGPIGTAVFTSLLWAIIHRQYGTYEISTIFVGGLVLCYARVRTCSIIPGMLIHSIVNLVSTIQVAIVVP